MGRRREEANGGSCETIEDDDIDIAGVPDIHDVDGKGAPLYADFRYEDWLLLFWAYELHLLAHAFRSDVNDPDHPGIPEKHVPHFYGLYYGTPCEYERLGVSSLTEIA